MIKKILGVIREEIAERRKEKLFKRIKALKFDGGYFAWLAKQLTHDTKVTVKSSDGVINTEYTVALIKGRAVDVIQEAPPLPKPGLWTGR